MVSRSVLGNGLTILVVSNPAVDIVSARFFIRSGSREERQPGLAHLVGAVLTKGTQNLSSQDIARQVESMGAILSTDTNPDYMQVASKCLGEDFPELFALTAEVLREASFPEQETELERTLTLQSIRSQQERPFTVAYNQFRRALYGEHPYAFSELGTDESVRALVPVDLSTFHRQHFRPDNLVLAVVGPILAEQVVTLAERYLGDWSAPAFTPVAPQLPVPAITAQKIHQTQATQQSTVLVGYAAAPITSVDYPVLKLISTYLGSGLSSRLFTELREKRGLAYEVSAFYPVRLDLSHFVTYIGTAPENTRTCEEGLRSEVERLCDGHLSDEELRTAKNKLLGLYALSKQTNSQVCQILGIYEALGMSTQFDEEYTQMVEQVSRQDVQTVARRTFGTSIVSLVGPAETLATV